MNLVLNDPGAIHPALWRGTQMGRYAGVCVPTGHEGLDAELPGGGWPQGALVDLLVQQPGVGEMRLLAPALKAVSRLPLMLLNPPHVPNHVAMSYWGLPVENVSWIKADKSSEALWAAEQILRSGTCGALLLWQNVIRNEHLRRLQLAAASGSTLFFALQPLNTQYQASPATLRIAVRPLDDGVSADIVKRKGPKLDRPIHLVVGPSPILLPKSRQPAREVADVPVLSKQSVIEHV